MSLPKVTLVGVVSALIGGGLGYGIKSASAPTSQSLIASPTRHHHHRNGQFAPLGGGASGTVAAVSSSSLEIQGPSGQTTIDLNATTTIRQFVLGSSSDIKLSDCVRVSGPTSSTGAVTAKSITILPAGSKGCAG